MKHVIGLFDNRANADQAQQELLRAGFPPTDVHIVQESPRTQPTSAGESFWDSVKDFLGLEHTDVYREAARRGGTLLRVRAVEDRADMAADIMNRHHPVDVDQRVDQWRKEGWAPNTATTTTSAPAKGASSRSAPAATGTAPTIAKGETVIPVTKEDINIGKRQVARGGVRVFTHVTETPVEKEVTLRDEHARVERRPADRPAGPDAFKEQSFEIRETHEEPVIHKEARVTEEVVIGKDVQQRTQKIKDTVRRTDVQVEGLEDQFRKDFQKNFAGSTYSFDQVRPAYDIGRDLAIDERHRTHDWTTVESDARQNLEKRYPGKWETLCPAVRCGYDETCRRTRARS